MRNHKLVGCEAWKGSDSGNLTKLWTLHEEGAQQAGRQAAGTSSIPLQRFREYEGAMEEDSGAILGKLIR